MYMFFPLLMNWEVEINSESELKATSLQNSHELTHSNQMYTYEASQGDKQMHIGNRLASDK